MPPHKPGDSDGFPFRRLPSIHSRPVRQSVGQGRRQRIAAVQARLGDLPGQALGDLHARRTIPFDMFACVLLPDHLHCIWSLPEGDDDFPARWASIKRFFTHYYLTGGGTELPVTESRDRQRGRGVWQPRYWEHRIRDELA